MDVKWTNIKIYMGLNVAYQKIISANELKKFQACAANHIGVNFPLGYLQKSSVYALYCDQGEMMGGFVLVKSGPFRVLESIPESDYVPHRKIQKWSSEITGVWLDTSRRGQKASCWFWILMYVKLLFSGKFFFLYAYSLKKPKLGELYSVNRPVVLYRGMTKRLRGMTDAEEESVEMFNLWGLLIAPATNPGFIIKRLSAGLGLRGALMKKLKASRS